MRIVRQCRELRPFVGATAACLMFVLSGCISAPDDAPELHPVAGKVTMDGQPLSAAKVVFTPQGGGRAIIGTTDESGEYQLEYSTSGVGAPAGDYVVSISTQRSEEEDPDSGATIPGAPETVPDTYNVASTLTAKVPGEPAAYQFDLKADAGKVVQRGTGVEPSGDREDGC